MFKYFKEIKRKVFNIFFFLSIPFSFSFRQFTTDSYLYLREICSEQKSVLIVIDLLDVGIEFSEPLLHSENRKLLMKKLKISLNNSFKIREYLKDLERKGFVEIKAFLYFWQQIQNKDKFLITDKTYYIPSIVFDSLNLNYDFYKKGVLFYKGDFWLKVIQENSDNYDCIIFISANKMKVKKFLNILKNKGIGVLFVNRRVPINEKYFKF